MYWQEEQEEEQFIVPDEVVDLSFSIKCRTLPVDHAAALAGAVVGELPWLAEEPEAGIHSIHGAESGNGWERPTGAEDILYLSRRTKLILRMPKERVEQAKEGLSGKTLDVDGNAMDVGKADQRLLSQTTTVYSRHVVAPEQEEDAFLARTVQELKSRRLQFKKVLCGKSFEINTAEGPLLTRSLLVADMPFIDAVRLQEQGVGSHRTLGCGLFIPHKTV
jgi:CRISPR-associated protein Cas6